MLTEKYHQLVSKPHPFIKLWINSIVTGGLIFAFLTWYQILSSNETNPWYLANQAAAQTGILLMTVSFAMSGIVYFWDFADHYLLYRKYWGLVGFGFALVHGLYSFTNYMLAQYQICIDFIPLNAGCINTGAFDLFLNWKIFGFTINNFIAFTFGLTALLIFTFMAAISNSWATRKLGKYWRWCLRLGYLALIFGALHAGIKRAAVWQYWLTHFEPFLPPLSLLTSILIIFTLLLRIILQISLIRKSPSAA